MLGLTGDGGTGGGGKETAEGARDPRNRTTPPAPASGQESLSPENHEVEKKCVEFSTTNCPRYT